MGPQLYRCGNFKIGSAPLRVAHPASMGPQLYRCGNMERGAPYFSFPGRFNGAATLSLRKRGRLAAHVRLVLPASMGPQLYRCGNDGSIVPHGGHFLASMGPQLYRCGNAYGVALYIYSTYASMGPQLYRCGNGPSERPPRGRCPRFNGAATLSLRKRVIMFDG